MFAYHRLKTLWAARWRLGDLVEFHTAHKLVLLAHSPQAYQELGRLVSGAKSLRRMSCASDTNENSWGRSRVLPRLAGTPISCSICRGTFATDLDGASPGELFGCIEDYRKGLVPLIVPVTLVAHYVRVFNVVYLKSQVYLAPHPKELALRNHV